MDRDVNLLGAGVNSEQNKPPGNNPKSAEAANPENPGTSTRLQHELDNIVMNVELTLISIIQGVALYFLSNSGTSLIAGHRDCWPYLITGLLIVFLFWSRSLIHTLTLIRWPLEFGHNFLYMACAVAQSILFAHVGDIQLWFVLTVAFSVLIWALFIFDLRMIRQRMEESQGPAGKRLFHLLEAEQLLNIRLLMPGLLVAAVASAGAVYLWPKTFIADGWHLALAAGQLGGSIAYLAYVLRFYRKIAPLVLETRREWAGQSGE